ncbi:hypothetical protein [Streptomyces sp. NPDC008092]|uniref:hypothetical protein n=1 Tax=Streptomyces sp. NPDC008092 TaxID=3364808 RepID=UPI0036EC68C1
MALESVEEFGNRWRDRALEAELEIERLKAQIDNQAVSPSVVLRNAADTVAMDRDYQLPADGPLKPGMDRAEKLLKRMADKLEKEGL